MMENYYEILGLRKGASETEIKKAYRRLARKYHPDVSAEPDAEERFVEISEAYQYLLEKPLEQSFVYEDVEPTPRSTPRERHEAARRERARRFAQMRYEQFRKESIAFQKSWYFTPVKILTRAVVYILYVVAALTLISPVIAWYRTNNYMTTIGFAFLAIVSTQVYALARSIYKETKKYFDEFESPG